MRALLLRRTLPVTSGIRKSKRVRILLLRRMLPVKQRASRKKATPRSLPLPRPPHLLPQIPARRLLLPFSTPSGPTSKDQTEDAAASMIVVDAVGAIAGGDAKAAGATGGQAAICRRQNMLRQSRLIRGRANLSPTNRPRLTISRLFFPASRSQNTKIESRPLPLLPGHRSRLSQTLRP